MGDVVARLSVRKLHCLLTELAEGRTRFVERCAFVQFRAVGTEIDRGLFRAAEIIGHERIMRFAISGKELLILIGQSRCLERNGEGNYSERHRRE